MKILQINTSDIQGGAARAAYRIHKGLQTIGIQSQMLVQSKKSDDKSIIGPTNKFNKALSLLRPTLDASLVKLLGKGSKTIFSPAWLPFSPILSQINTLSPDIVHLHWVCGGMLRPKQLKKINKPLVWTLHDMWAFTGGCHYSENCEGYKKQCGNCPQLNKNKLHDLSYSIHKRKKKAWEQLDLTIVTPSHWLAESVRQSDLFSNRRIEVIHNGLDTDLFKPIEKSVARSIWKLPENKKLILFGAMGAISDPRKGFDILVKALDELDKQWAGEAECIIFGNSEPKNLPVFGFPVHYTGHLHDDVSLALLYSAADVMVVPSRQEAFGQTASESMSCGTPVVAFGATGLLDIVEHKQNGYLAQPYDSDDLAKSIEWVLADEERHKQLCYAARKKAVANFDLKKVAKQYADLYQSLL
jgi:glycosyltransferase involved in cell wall biosynthesis